jgi:hypothetical protein
MLRLVSDHPVPDRLPDLWLRAVVQWQIVWLQGYAAGCTTLADIANAQVERMRP